MNGRLCLLLGVLTTVGCATPIAVPESATLPEGMRVNLITARDAAVGRGAIGVADYFTFEGKVVAFASFTWSNLEQAWGKQKIEFHWYNGDRLVRRTESEPNFGRPPHHVWSTSYPTALGAGEGRVEVHWRGQKLAQRAFRVVDASGPDPVAPAQRRPARFHPQAEDVSDVPFQGVGSCWPHQAAALPVDRARRAVECRL